MKTLTLEKDYASFLTAPTRKQWQRIGLGRRSGVAVPLFSIYSRRSAGIGEFTDLKLLIDWCVSAGMSIIQLLPMNDVGYDFRPYDAQSTFAMEPMYLNLGRLAGVPRLRWLKELRRLRNQFPTNGKVNYGIKKAKIELLWKIYSSIETRKNAEFDRYCEEQKYWLRDYALFRALKEAHGQIQWEAWLDPYKFRDLGAMGEFEKKQSRKIRFYEWIQWQLWRQFLEVKEYAFSKKIFLMGDLPFLVSRDSADAWSHQDYFKLHLASGAPPDAYFAFGQRWGMPPYHWENIAAQDYQYLKSKLRYAENFYDLFRIDHVVGMFRLWTIDLNEPWENAGLNGRFDPEPPEVWEEHGRRLLSVMVENTSMLPCAEDLGVVPECSYKVLSEFAIPGMDVQRWQKDPEKDFEFKPPWDYRKNSIAVISSHDMSSFRGWWMFEADTVDETLFMRKCREKNIPFEEIQAKLFDLPGSHYGRLRWKNEVETDSHFLDILGRPALQVLDLLDLYRFSFGEREKFWDYIECPKPLRNEVRYCLIWEALRKAGETNSIFSVQFLTDWLSLDKTFQEDPWKFRINFPGQSGGDNWSIVMPISLERLKKLKINHDIRKINRLTKRR